MKKYFLLGVLISGACNQIDKKNAINDLQKIRSLLPTANWRIIDGADTSYIYFSDQFDSIYKTYEYKLVRGDSSVVYEGSIEAYSDSVVWDWNNHSLRLEEAADSKLNWKEKTSDEKYVLQKINDSSLQLSSPEKQWRLKRILPLTTFLVRARYDYEHGTKCLDSVEVPPQQLIQHK
jgi:hypothetical protein